ncbi:MAG: rod shape-determining protein [Desulfohalobiaceae bacterium]|nr:rod shape-determining protein [Desulfohalobiaceae bacterium]
MLLNKLFNFFGKDLAMDLGTANTLIHTPRDGIVLNEPSVVALSNRDNKVLAVGAEAKEYLGRAPEKKLRAIRPMKDGVIADFDVTSAMIATFIRKVLQGVQLIKPRIMICVPTGITQVEKQAVIQSAQQAGARQVLLLEEPVAAAIGGSLPITEPIGNMVVDIGGGTTEVGIISLSAVAYSESIRVAGDEMDEAIQRFIREEYGLLIGETAAEKLKMNLHQGPTARITGKSLVEGVPQAVQIDMARVRESIREPISAIVNTVLRTLEKSPPELVSDVMDHGILLTGGGALLYGLPQQITQQAQVSTFVDDDPLTTALRGTGAALQQERELRDMFLN